ncbi:unnamed protein product [Choristocarpus tenellus]
MRDLELELEGRLSRIETLEKVVVTKTEANTCLEEKLRSAEGRIRMGAMARKSLLDFCQQQREAVEREANEHAFRAREEAAMRSEEDLGREMEIVQLAEAEHEAKSGALQEEVDRLSREVFRSRAQVALKDEEILAVRRELHRAAEAIAGLSRTLEGFQQGKGGRLSLPTPNVHTESLIEQEGSTKQVEAKVGTSAEVFDHGGEVSPQCTVPDQLLKNKSDVDTFIMSGVEVDDLHKSGAQISGDTEGMFGEAKGLAMDTGQQADVDL